MTGRKAILIVEDNPSVSSVYREYCELKFDASIYVAATGAVALDIAMEKPLDLILCDLMLPDMSGFDVISKLRTYEAYSKIPIIIISAVAEKGRVTLGFKMGATDYIIKPASLATLQEKILHYLPDLPLKHKE